MAQAAAEPPTNGVEKIYTVTLRGRSSARLLPEDGLQIFFDDVPGSAGPVRFRVRTRWVDEGYAAPLPRELWIEARGPAPSLNLAMTAFGATGRAFANLLAFTANTSAEIPEVHLAYDATPGATQREFIEVFLPDERGHPRQGRIVRPSEVQAVMAGLQQQPDTAQLSLALQQYAMALRYWSFGSEWLSLAHLYMAAETLTEVILTRACADQDRNALAAWLGIDTSDSQKWRHELQVWARRDVIFEGDNTTYRDARRASDGIEHGFLEFSEINRHAVATTDATFGYLRRTILRLLAVSEVDHPHLYNVVPRDVESLRKFVRGHFLGDGSDPSAPDEEYPLLEWKSDIRTVERDGDTFKFSFQENFTVQCSPAYVFQGKALEARGRLEPGDEPIRIEEIEQISVRASAGSAPVDQLSALLTRANQLATAASAASTTVGIPTQSASVFSIFAAQVALQEAVHVLIRDHRPVEAMILVRSLILNACRLESIANHPDPPGAALRLTIDSLERQTTLFKSHPDAVDLIRQHITQCWVLADANKIHVPAVLPDIRKTAFFATNAESLQVADEVASAGDAAAKLHTVKDGEGNSSLHTQVTNARLTVGVAVTAVEALLASTVAAMAVLQWQLDADAVAEVAADAKRLQQNHTTSAESRQAAPPT